MEDLNKEKRKPVFRLYSFTSLGMIFFALSLSTYFKHETITQLAEMLPKTDPVQTQIQQRVTEYTIKAKLFILGDLGSLGNMALEENSHTDGDTIEKVLRMYGNTDPKQVKKGRDFSGDLKIIKRLPLKPDGSVDLLAVDEGKSGEIYYSGVLKKNETVEREEVVFYSDRAVSNRGEGEPKIIEGKYASPLSALEHFLENDVEEGDVFESDIIIDSSPKIYRCEVGKKEYLEEYRSHAYKIDVLTFDGLKKDKNGQPLAIKKKGGIRLWLCKDGEFKDRFLRLEIKYKWYLKLAFQMRIIRQKPQTDT